MGVLTSLQGRFAEVRGSPRFEEAWKELKAKHLCLRDFEWPEELRDFCRDPKIDYARQDPVVFALCAETRAEAQAGTTDRLATDLLFWIFLPALWKVVDQAERASDFDPDDLQAEVLDGFWEAAIKDRASCKKLSGRLVNAARHQVWRAIRRQAREAHASLDAIEEEEEPDRPDPEWADPWLLVCYAQLQGEINETEAEILFWTKFQDEPVGKVAEALGLSYWATHSQLRRTQEKLVHWLDQLGDGFPPRDRDLAREIRNLAQKPSNLAQLMGRKHDQKRP